MGKIVIACYRPRPGKEEALRALMRQHVPTLRGAELLTSREAVTMTASDGTVVEVFEWASAEAVDRAHQHPAVQELWQKLSEVCDYVPVSQVREASELYSEFSPL